MSTEGAAVDLIARDTVNVEVPLGYFHAVHRSAVPYAPAGAREREKKRDARRRRGGRKVSSSAAAALIIRPGSCES